MFFEQGVGQIIHLRTLLLRNNGLAGLQGLIIHKLIGNHHTQGVLTFWNDLALELKDLMRWVSSMTISVLGSQNESIFRH